MIFQKAAIGEPGKFYRSQDELYALVPDEVTVNYNNNTITEHGYLLAISQDGGRFWYFIYLNGKGPESIRKLVPKLNKDLVLPPSQPNTIVPDKQ